MVCCEAAIQHGACRKLEGQSRQLQATADKMNLKLKVQKAATDREIERAFQAFASQRVDALLVTADPLFNNRRAQVLALAASQSLPAIYQWREFVTNGGLMSYGPSMGSDSAVQRRP